MKFPSGGWPADVSEELEATVTRRWLQRFVVDLKLCPFAAQAKPRIAVSRVNSEQALLTALASEIDWLQDHDGEETSLLVHPNALTDFLDYNDFLELCDDFLRDQNLEGVYQIASFHPSYQFANTQPEDAENFANRSPYPMLHVLREDSVSRAIDSHPDIERVPLRNAEVLGKLGTSHLNDLWCSCFSDDD